MNKTTKFLLPLLGLCLAAGVEAKVMQSSVATVNGRPILASEYEALYQATVDQYKAAAPQALEQPYAYDLLGKEIIKDMLSKELLRQAAEEAKVQVKDSELEQALAGIKNRFIVDEKGQQDPKGAEKRFNEALKKQHLTLKTYKEKLRKDIAVQKLIETQMQTMIKPVEEADAKALYNDVENVLKNKTKAVKKLEKEDPLRFKEASVIAARLAQETAERVRAGHIYLAVTKEMPAEDAKKKEELAKQIKKELDDGLDFSSAVKKYTEDQAALASGGDIILIKGLAPKAIDQAVFSLAVGKVSAPIKSEVGWHIFKVKEKRAKQEVAYEQVATSLAQYLAEKKAQLAMAEYLNSLADKADIKVTKTFEVDKVIEKAAAEKAEQEAKAEAKAEAKKEAAAEEKKTK